MQVGIAHKVFWAIPYPTALTAMSRCFEPGVLQPDVLPVTQPTEVQCFDTVGWND